MFNLDGVRGDLKVAGSWDERISIAKQAGNLKPIDRLFLIEKAGNWKTCAIGENREALVNAGFEFNGAEPAPGSEHTAYGLLFSHAIGLEDWDLAEDVLGRIKALAGYRELVAA